MPGFGELITRGYERWNEGDRTFVLEHLAPDVEWHAPPDDPDRAVYRGHDGITRFWDQWRAAVGQLRFDVLDFTEFDGGVIAHARRSGRGEGSGLEVSDEVFQVFSFNDEGKCTRVHEFYERADALRAAGIEPNAVEAS